MAARGLGKGLDALIPSSVGNTEIPKTKSSNAAKAKQEKAEEKKAGETMVNITMVEPNREQPRKNFDEDALEELAESIKQFGLLQPILVQDRKTYYEIVEIALIENIQREDLNPIEEALAYKKLLTEFNLKQDEVAERVSKSRTAVTNSMRLLKLCDEVQEMIVNDMISTGHARALISIEDPEQQYTIAQKVFDEKLSVREVEKLVKDLGKPAKVKKLPVVDRSLEVVYQDIEEKLKQKLSTKVSISSKGNGTGKMEIEFYSHDDLEKLVEILSK